MSVRTLVLKKKSTTAFLSLIIGLCVGSVTYADPITHTLTVGNTDWTSAGVAGIGSVGTGTITLSGISGTVDTASLYWHGIGNPSYDNDTVSIDGNQVTGTVIGTGPTNCWSGTNSVAYQADVSAFVSGDGAYVITGMATSDNSGNGASIVVTYDDGNPSNNRDIAFFEGNDSSDPGGFPGEDIGWHATLTPIEYDGSGTVTIQFHAGDGQHNGTDGPVTLATTSGSITFPDDATLWDGLSVPSAGNGRNGLGLWDIHDFDITAAFGGVAGSGISLDLDGQDSADDCLGLVLAIVDFPPNSLEPLEPQEPVDVPTLSTWSVLLMIAMIALLGVFAYRRSNA